MENDKKLKYQLRCVHLLKSMRIKNKWTQKDLAAELGFSNSYIERLESKTNPDNTLVNSFLETKKFADLAEMSVTEFISYIEGYTIERDPIFDELIKKIEKLEIEDQIDVIEIFKKNSPSFILKCSKLMTLLEKKKKTKFMSNFSDFLVKMEDIVNG